MSTSTDFPRGILHAPNHKQPTVLFLAGFNDEFPKKQRRNNVFFIQMRNDWLSQFKLFHNLDCFIIANMIPCHPSHRMTSVPKTQTLNFMSKAWQKIISSHHKIFKWSWIIWKMKYINQVWEPHPKSQGFWELLSFITVGFDFRRVKHWVMV